MNYYEQKKKWLEGLKAGDVVGRTGSMSGAPVAVTVDRVTATQIIIGHSRYRKEDGYAIGHYSRFSRPSIVEITPSVRRDMELRDLQSWATHANWQASSLEQLRAMKKAHDEAALGHHPKEGGE